MTNKIYRTAMGKTVDIGALMLQNETVRAVGNMGVNARGDRVDSQNNIVDRKNQQAQRNYARQTSSPKPPVQESFPDLPQDNDVVVDKKPQQGDV